MQRFSFHVGLHNNNDYSGKKKFGNGQKICTHAIVADFQSNGLKIS
jgi:hypothetical protein